MPEILKTKKFYIISMLILLCLTAGYFLLCQMASQQASELFRREMNKQRVLLGSVSADTVQADLFGNVELSNLVWLDKKGEPVLHIPHARLKVSTWDIITGRAGLNTLQRIELDDAVISLSFNERMQMDVLTAPKAHTDIVKQAAEQHNLDLRGKMPNLTVALHNCTLNVLQQKRYFVLNQVQAEIVSKADDFVKINFETGLFGGTIVGDKLKLTGQMDISQADPKLNFNLSMYKIVPASLGLGNIQNTADVFTEFKGTLQHPVADGALRFETLDLPALHFSKVNGNLHYESGKVDFTDVSGSIYGGTVDAFGWYELDNRHYSIDLKGHDLLASIAARSRKINCRVELDLKIRSEGRADTVHTYGSFKSGPGSYMLIPFESISGTFDDRNKVLAFRNVVIKTDFGNVVTDGFKLIDGKLYIEDVFLEAPDGSEKIKVR